MGDDPITEHPGVEIWRGGVNSWECDEMGHMNVRFYVAKAIEGLAGLAAELGLSGAFAPHANATVTVREQHIRFLKEAHEGAPLAMTGGVIAMDECEARVLLLLIHPNTGELAASFQTTIVHVTAREGRPFPWPARTRARAEALRVEIPERAQARSIELTPVVSMANLQHAVDLGLMRVALGVVGPQDCDVFGRMRPELFAGRVSDGVGALVRPLRDIVTAHADPKPTRVGGAVLEYRLVHLGWPQAGDRYEIRSGFVGTEGRTMRIVHWLLDPDTGLPWGTSEAVAITFDLDARKAVGITGPAQAQMMQSAVKGLTL